jgi:hypothetical protein
MTGGYIDRPTDTRVQHSSIAACIRWGGNVFTEPLPSNDWRDTYRDTHSLTGEVYKYAVEMGSGAMIYIPSFVQTGSGIQKLTGGNHRHTDCMEVALPRQ